LFLLACLFISLVSVVAARGRLMNLADVEFRAVWAVVAALALQVLVVTVIPTGPEGALRLLHVCSYLLAAGFVVANRAIPGVVPIGVGGLMNLTAIVANGGVMPATAAARATAGLSNSGEFANSAAVAHAKLVWLGDVFAIPDSWPLSNTFSPGDVVIAVGLLVGLHGICGSRLSVRRHLRARPAAHAE
jgi:hypothetical protein